MNLLFEGAKAGIGQIGKLISGDDTLPEGAPDQPAQEPPPVQTDMVRAETPEDIAAGLGIRAPRTGLAPAPDTSAGFRDVFGAAWGAHTIEHNIFFEEGSRYGGLALDMEAQLPFEERVRLRQQFAQGGQWDQYWQAVVSAAAADAAANPEKWGEFPLTRAAFKERIKAERDEDLAGFRAVLAQPGGETAEFMGRMTRGFFDEYNMALLPFGFQGGLLRTVLGEAALGMAGEALSLPREYRVARELGLPEPDALSNILWGGVLGGAFAGAIVGGAKGAGWAYNRTISYREARRTAQPEGMADVEAEALIAAEETKMRGQPTVQQALKDAGPIASETDPPPGTLGAVAGANLPNTPGLGYNEGATLRAIIQVESGGRANAQADTSSARGLGQFIDSTWMGMIRRHRPDLLGGRTTNQVLALRDDPNLNAEMTRLYMRENSDYLAARGVQAGPGEIYLAHFMGPAGAAKALSAPASARLSSVMTPKQIAANAGIRYNGKRFADFTVYDLRMWARNKMRSAYDPNAPSDIPNYPTSRGYTGEGQVTAGDGFRIDVDYQVVDAASLLRASGDLQPRDRSRMSSDAWISDTAARLDPAQLMPSPTADRGTPIVGPDNVIESGNGRFGAISRAYERHPDRAATYRGAIEAAGFAIPEGVERPVLIARRKTELSPEERSRFAIEAQDSGVAVMTPTEIARTQSRAMTSPVLAQLDPSAPLKAEGNAGFVRAAMQSLPRSARNAMFDANGMLNNLGERQLREALFARAWPDPDILARFTETDAGELKSLMEALERAAPSWAALKADIEAGLVNPEMDISAFVLDAMRLIGAARDLSKREGLPIAKAVQDLVEDIDLIEGAISPLTAAMVRKFWKNGRAASADEIAGFLTRYADDARKAGAAGGLFDAPGPRDVLRAIDDKTFGDLPDDLGQARGFAQPGDQAAPVTLSQDGYETGTHSPEAALVLDEIRAEIEGPDRNAAGAELTELRRAIDIEMGDFTFRLPDGTRERLGRYMDELDKDAAANAAFQACAVGPNGGGA